MVRLDCGARVVAVRFIVVFLSLISLTVFPLAAARRRPGHASVN